MRAPVVILVIALVAGCGSGSPFVPAVGPFSGVLTTNGQPTGQFQFTYGQGAIGGTGMLTIDGNLVPVSIAASVQGISFSGELRNVNLGGGTFTGVFNSDTISSGSFTYIDTAQTVNLSGTWTARVVP
jgi:hypothetical protein